MGDPGFLPHQLRTTRQFGGPIEFGGGMAVGGIGLVCLSTAQRPPNHPDDSGKRLLDIRVDGTIVDVGRLVAPGVSLATIHQP